MYRAILPHTTTGIELILDQKTNYISLYPTNAELKISAVRCVIGGSLVR